MREADDDKERAILAALDDGVSDKDLTVMLRDLADILRGKGGHIGARVAEIAAAEIGGIPIRTELLTPVMSPATA